MTSKEIILQLLIDTLDTIGDNMREGGWSESNVKVYCTANGLNVLDTKILVGSVNDMLALEYYRSDNIQQTDQSKAKKYEMISNDTQINSNCSVGDHFETVL